VSNNSYEKNGLNSRPKIFGNVVLIFHFVYNGKRVKRLYSFHGLNGFILIYRGKTFLDKGSLCVNINVGGRVADGVEYLGWWSMGFLGLIIPADGFLQVTIGY